MSEQLPEGFVGSSSDKLASYNLEGLAQMEKAASMFIQAGYAPKGMTEAQLVLVAQAGRELGFGPTTSMRQLYVVNNKVTLQGGAMLALIQNSGKCKRMAFEWDKDKKAWEVTMERADFELAHTERFTLAQADAISVMEKGKWIKLSEKFVWKQYPKTMIYWRALAACARKVFADVIEGLYLPEELGAEVEVLNDDTHEVRIVDVQVHDNAPEEESAPEDTDTEAELELGELKQELHRLGEQLDYSKQKVEADIRNQGTPDELLHLVDSYNDLLAEQTGTGEAKPLFPKEGE